MRPSSSALCGAALALTLAACGDDTSTVEPGKAGVRGSSCQADNDCADGLTCFGLRCVVRDFDVVPSARDCVANFCGSDRECCEFYGNCDFVDWQCLEGRCVTVCGDDLDCPGGFCVSDRCVQCRTTADCFDPDAECVEGACVAPECEVDADCTGGVEDGIFEACEAGQCVEVGCQNDRQCKAALNDATAICEQTGVSSFDRCIVPCEIDAQCANASGFEFFGCVDQRCQYLGCEDDRECAAQCVAFGCGLGFGQPPPIEYLCVDRST